MMNRDPLAKLIFELSKLPGIGEKTAGRLAYHILRQDRAYAAALSEAILGAKESLKLCTQCFSLTDRDLCVTCSNSRRDHGVICVVERPSDVQAVEAAGPFGGVYHVLHGTLSPLDGVGPEDLKIRELLGRIEKADPPVREVILAANPSVEGEATSLYLSRLIRPLGVRVTRLAHGLPVGGALEFTDRQTLSKALENRVELNPA
ncbi:MAG TPA: recombination mediator RecR [Bdellovibrionota bacterium]|jgi:recombination protein RecR|nr:recombination mediator RecR [Bdellovibrionota bacterium]